MAASSPGSQSRTSSDHQNVAPINILDPIFVDDWLNDDVKYPVKSYHNPQDIIFSHKFIISEISKFGLSTDSCINCSQLVKHLVDPRSLTDALSENKITWVKLPQSKLLCPYPHLDTPIYDPSNIKVKQNPFKPKYFIRVTRLI